MLIKPMTGLEQINLLPGERSPWKDSFNTEWPVQTGRVGCPVCVGVEVCLSGSGFTLQLREGRDFLELVCEYESERHFLAEKIGLCGILEGAFRLFMGKIALKN
jgi:hypothetical protein